MDIKGKMFIKNFNILLLGNDKIVIDTYSLYYGVYRLG